jgi:hypothetical protein
MGGDFGFRGLTGRAVQKTTLVSNHSVTLWRMLWESQPETQPRVTLPFHIVLCARHQTQKLCHKSM